MTIFVILIMVFSPILFFAAPFFARGWRSLFGISFLFGWFLTSLWIDAYRFEMRRGFSQGFEGFADHLGIFVLTTICFIASVVRKSVVLWVRQQN